MPAAGAGIQQAATARVAECDLACALPEYEAACPPDYSKRGSTAHIGTLS